MSWFQAWIDWLSRSKDVVATITATLAIILTLVTVILQRGQHNRQGYREIYNTLMSEDLHKGRWLINTIDDESKYENALKEPGGRALIYRTLGIFDNLALYARKRIVPRRWVLRIWHHPLKQMEPSVKIIWMVDRKGKNREEERKAGRTLSPWPDLQWLFRKADAYVSMLPCCTEEDSRGRQIWKWTQLRATKTKRKARERLLKIRARLSSCKSTSPASGPYTQSRDSQQGPDESVST
jgi:hypothetical protein